MQRSAANLLLALGRQIRNRQRRPPSRATIRHACRPIDRNRIALTFSHITVKKFGIGQASDPELIESAAVP